MEQLTCYPLQGSAQRLTHGFRVRIKGVVGTSCLVYIGLTHSRPVRRRGLSGLNAWLSLQGGTMGTHFSSSLTSDRAPRFDLARLAR